MEVGGACGPGTRCLTGILEGGITETRKEFIA